MTSSDRVKTVTRVQRLSTGYVRVDAGGVEFAQMPAATWDALPCGEIVPDEFAFDARWCRMRKGDQATGDER
jgi:hypothetical protein